MAEAVAAAVAAAKAEADEVIKGKDTEIGTLKKVSAEKTENFKKYNDLTVEEKAAYDAKLKSELNAATLAVPNWSLGAT